LIISDINTINAEFSAKGRFTNKQLQKVLEALYPDINVNTLKWKIHDLKEKGVIRHVTRGVYSLAEEKQSYLPDISAEEKEIYKNLRQELPYAELSIAHTGWFNEFMLHQVFRTYLIIEVEKEAAPTIFNKLLEQDRKVFLNPGREIFEYYISNTENPIIVKSLITESPLVELDDIKVASLEKLLVDCICDTEIYSAQYQEASSIFDNAMEKYPININKLKRYARRRNRIPEISNLINRDK
jgi:predicted transcriptional regulator of viral defense system